MTDQNVLAKVVCETKFWKVRRNAVKWLTDQNLLAKVACEAEDAVVREDAVNRLTDQNLLAKLACEDKEAVVRVAAVNRLTDQNLLAKLACEAWDWSVRKASFIKIDSAHLAVLGKETKDPSVALAVRIKLNQEDWVTAFSPTKLSQASLGNVLGAVALVDNPQPNNESVVAACHAFIRQGDSSRIPELRDLLVRFGDKPLAEDYLNCGQNQLHDAGVEWARAHGLNVGTGFGSHRIRWGEGR